MPVVPTRDAPSVAGDMVARQYLRQPDMGRLPNSSGIRFTPIDTPQIRGGQFEPGRFRPGAEAGITEGQAMLPGAQLMATGQAMGRAGATMADIVADIQAQTNALVSDAAVNRAKEVQMRLVYDKDIGLTSQRGYDALNRPDGKPLSAEYVGKFDDAINAISGELKNDEQRRLFNAQASGMRLSLQNQAIQHEAQAFREYNLSVQEGTIKTEIENVALNYNNPEELAPAVERIKMAVFQQGQALGKSAAWIEAQQREMTSKAHATALTAALQADNIAYADAYLRKYSEQMTANDVLQVRGVISKEVDGRLAIASAINAMGQEAVATDGSDMSIVIGITAQAESGNRERDAKGNLITSSAGAQGKMQVMPGTNRDPGFGVRPAQDDSDAERTRVGRDYMDAMIKRYGGDLSKAWAAYNWGPGNLDDAMAKARKPENQGKTWFDFAPKETRDYVTNNLQAYQARRTSAAPKMTLEAVLARVDADPSVNSSPTRLAAARQEATRRFNVHEASIKAKNDELEGQAIQELMANGGNFMGLSTALRAALPADKLSGLLTFADKVASGSTVSNMALYQRLSDDTYLKSLSDAEFYKLRPELSASDFKHFANERAKPESGGQSPGDLNSGALNAVLKERLQTMGLDPKKDADRYGAVTKFVRQQLINAQQQANKKFNDAEVEKLVDGLFLKSRDFDTVLWGGIRIDGPTKQLLGMTLKDVPEDVRQTITDQLKKRGQPVTEGAILGIYWNRVSTDGD